MGWTNYVVIPKMKCAIEVRKEISDRELELFIENVEMLIHVLDDTNPELLDTPTKDMSIGAFGQIISIADKAGFMRSDTDIETYFLLYFLKYRKIPFEIMHEEKFDKHQKEKYAGYAIIRFFR